METSLGACSRSATVVVAVALAALGCELLNPRSASAPAPSASAAPSPEPEPQRIAMPLRTSEPEQSPPAPDEPVEPGVVQAGGPTRGSLPKAAINEGLARGEEEFERCYLRAAKPGLRGVIRVNFVIAPDGTVPHAAALAQGTDFPDGDVIDCVVAAFQKLTFAKPSGGRVVSTYPLKLEPLPDAPAPSP